MKVRLKFRVIEHTQRPHWGQPGKLLGGVKLSPVIGGSDENNAFYEATPARSIEFHTINQAALEALPVNAEVYVTLEVVG